MRCNALLMAPTMLTSYVLDLREALASIFLGSVSSAFLPGVERMPTQTHLLTAFRRSVQLVHTTVLPFSPFLPDGIRSF